MATTYLKLTNRGKSSLAADIDNSELVITVQTGDGALFPSTFPFHVTVGDEIMSCTSRATDALTVTRGVEGTSGAVALEGAVLTLNITAAILDTITVALTAAEAAVATLITELNTAEADIATAEAAIDVLEVIVTVPIADPGNGNAIPVTVSGVVPIVTGGAETRTIADPTFAGQEMIIGFKTDGGNCTITTASPVNQTGNNTLLGEDVGDYIHLVGSFDGADLEWRIVANDGWALSTV